MKIIFMGTPDFSVPTLQTLIDSKHQVVACFTQPDKPKGRGNKVQKTPVKELCEKYDIPVYQPVRIRRSDEVELFGSIEADIAVVIAYGQILPKKILESPKYGCLNIHASLLPSYRGAAPYQWAVINGEEKTGITIMQMDVGMDTGDMLLTQEILMDPFETAGSLHDKLMLMGGPLILEALDKVEEGTLNPVSQDDSMATHAPMLSKDAGVIDWTMPVERIERLIRGLNPWPSSFTYINGLMLKIYAAHIYNDLESQPNLHKGTSIQLDSSLEFGTICNILPKTGFVVKCNGQNLLVKEVQLEGKKRMDAPAFMRGYLLEVGTKLG